MKRIQLSVLLLATTTNLIMAGGDLLTVTPYEIEDIQASEYLEVIAPPTPVVFEPIPTPPVVIAPVPSIPVPVVIAPAVATESVSPIYLGLGLVAARYDTNCGCEGDKSGVDTTGGVLVKAGYDFNKYLGVEARGLITTVGGNGGKVQHFGLFAKPMIPVTDGLNVYGLIGAAKTTTSGTLRKTDVSGLAFGAGLEYDLSDDKKKDAKYDREFDGQGDQEKGFGVFADYERLYYKKNSPDLDAVSVGVTYDF